MCVCLCVCVYAVDAECVYSHEVHLPVFTVYTHTCTHTNTHNRPNGVEKSGEVGASRGPKNTHTHTHSCTHTHTHTHITDQTAWRSQGRWAQAVGPKRIRTRTPWLHTLTVMA